MTELEKDALMRQLIYALRLSAGYLQKADNEGLMTNCVITPRVALQTVQRAIDAAKEVEEEM